MEFVKEWSFYVCITVVASVVLTFLTPKSSMGNFYKIIISVFIFLSFLYPFLNFDINDLKLPNVDNTSFTYSNNSSLAKDMLSSKINELLINSGIKNANIDVDLSINDANEIVVDSIIVTVDKDYNSEEIKNLIYENLKLDVSVKNFAN